MHLKWIEHCPTYSPSREYDKSVYGCETCKRQLSLNEIVEAFIEVENVFEDTAEIAIFFVLETGNVSVQSIKQEGDRRHKLSIVPITNAEVEDILLTFKNTFAKCLNISILDLNDLFQN